MTGGAEYCGELLERKVFAIDRGANAVKADLGALLAAGLKAGVGLNVEGGGRAGSEAGG